MAWFEWQGGSLALRLLVLPLPHREFVLNTRYHTVHAAGSGERGPCKGGIEATKFGEVVENGAMAASLLLRLILIALFAHRRSHALHNHRTHVGQRLLRFALPFTGDDWGTQHNQGKQVLHLCLRRCLCDTTTGVQIGEKGTT